MLSCIHKCTILLFKKNRMIRIERKEDCHGCCACVDACPYKAISLKNDIEGFWYPNINMDLCIDCGICNKVCSELHIDKIKKNDFDIPTCYAAIHKNVKIRWDSTSGGIFSALAQKTYEEGGYVGGAIYNEDFSVKNYISDNFSDLELLRSSKYLQSKALGIYRNIKDLLKQDKKVLVCGTPCQMASLRTFLGKKYDNLIIVDFICRGVNSPKVYRKYLDSLEEKFHSKVIYVKAKNKELGWRNLTRKVVFENGQTYYGVFMEDDFRRGYHTNVFCRPSCYECKYKGFPRIADITIGDFWGVEKVDKNLDNNIGTSVVMVNSKKGKEYFNSILDNIEFKKVPFASIQDGNPALKTPISKAEISRKDFFEDLDKHDFRYVTNKYFPHRFWQKTLKSALKQNLRSLMRLGRSLRFNIYSYYNFLKINFLRKNTNASWCKDNYLVTMPGAIFDLHPSAKIDLNASIIYGNPTIKGLKLPTSLKMEANTVFELNEGPLTRYGTAPYNLRSGACIEIINGGKLTIGQGACNVGLTIMCAKEITIGNGVRIGRNVSIRDWNGSHVIISDTYKNHSPVIINDHVWICTGATIMPGVTIGEGAVIAANSLVTKNVPPKSLVGGNPAKVIKENIEWY